MAAADGSIERTTEMAVVEKAKLQKALRRFDMLFFTLCALIGLDTLGQVSAYGAKTFAWLAILAVAFLLPYALVMAELGSAFPQEGGPYEWMKLAYGRFTASMGAILYWVTNPLWVGGSLCFLATAAWSSNIHAIGTRSVGDYLFKLAFIWISIGVAVASLRRGKWIPNLGAFVRVGVLWFFSFTVIIYGLEHGFNGYAASEYNPFGAGGLAIFLGLVPLLLFNYVGFELQSAAAEEMVDPQKDVPTTVVWSAVITALSYAVPVLGILLVIPTKDITGVHGFLDAVTRTFSVYGPAQDFLVDVMAIGFIFALVTSGSVWMMGSDRIQAVASYDGGFLPFFGVFNSYFGTPVRVNVLSGVVSTLFMFAAQQLSSGSNAATFKVVLYLATSTTLLSYLLIFPAAWRLRQVAPDVPRPYRLGRAGNGLIAVCSMICLGWMLLGSWVAVFPGTIESLFGIDYSIQDAYGVSRVRFEVFTLGTLAIILVVGVIGYVLAAPVRRREVDIPLAVPVAATGD
jgi:glutamate:GABA antiporter